LAELKGTGHQFALKAMKKAEIYEVSAPATRLLSSLLDALRSFEAYCFFYQYYLL
jgi:hypothetical protein